MSKYISTIGVDYGVKGIALAGEEVKVNFWDLAGSKEYLEVRNEFYKDSQGCLLVGNCFPVPIALRDSHLLFLKGI